MVYSQFILAKKGPLGTIWIAAHLERKLRKNQAADTDIGISVEFDESKLDGLGILPQRKQHKNLFLQALVGEGSGEELLFSSENSLMNDSILYEPDRNLQKFKDQYWLLICSGELGICCQTNRYQVLDALVSLFCRGNLSAETLWTGGWLLSQLLLHSEEEFTPNHLKQLKLFNQQLRLRHLKKSPNLYSCHHEFVLLEVNHHLLLVKECVRQ